GRPVGFLVTLLVVTVVVAVALAGQTPRVTELGRRTLGQLRGGTSRPAVGASAAQVAMGVALFGAGALWAADTDTALLMRIPREHSTFGGVFADGGGGGGGAGGGGGGGGGGGWGGGGGGRRRGRRGVRRMPLAGVGIGWRPELAGFVARRQGLGF